MPSAKELLAVYGQLKSERSALDAIYDDVSCYVLPREQDLVRARPGENRVQPNDTTAVRACKRLASALVSNAVTPGKPWFQLRAPSRELEQHDDVQAWLTDAAAATLRAIQGSNFNTAVAEALTLYAGFGTGTVYVDLLDGGLDFLSLQVRDVYLAEGGRRRIDTLFWRFSRSARAAVAEYGEDAVHPEVQKQAADVAQSYAAHEYVQVVMPRPGPCDPSCQAPKRMAWASYVVDVQNEHIVLESGYRSFPFAVPRFYTPSTDPYGRGAGMDCLPDVRGLMRSKASWLDASELRATPCVFLPDYDSTQTIDLRPGAVNAYRADSGGKPLFYDAGGADPRAALEVWQEAANAIRETFMLDQFHALEAIERSGLTATEVMERVAEKIQAISPVVARLQTELLTPLVERSLGLLLDCGRIAKAPAGLDEYEVQYTSRLDARLSQHEVNTVLTTVRELGEVETALEAAKETRGVFNLSKVGRFIARSNNVPADLLRTEREERDYLAAAAKAAQEQQTADALPKLIRPVDLQQPTPAGAPLGNVAGAGLADLMGGAAA